MANSRNTVRHELTHGNERHRFGRTLCFLAAMMLALTWPASWAAAQNDPTDGTDSENSQPWWGIVTAEALTMRSGPHERYYEVGTLRTGEFVRVFEVDGESGWARIASPERISAFVRATDVVLAPDGESATAPAKTYGLHNNRDNPAESWRRFVIDADTQVTVRGRVEARGAQYYRISIPGHIAVSVRAEYVRRATDDEVANYLNPPSDEAEAETGDLAAANEPQIEPGATPPASDTNLPVQEESVPDLGANQPGAIDDDEESNTTGTETPSLEEDASDSADDASTPSDTLNPNMPLRIEPQEAPAREDDNSNDTPTDEAPAVVKETIPQQRPLLPPSQDPAITDITTDEPDSGEALTDPEVIEDESSTYELPIDPSPENLEPLYQATREVPLMEAEIEPLLNAYRILEQDETQDTSIRRLARARIAVLETRLEIQETQRGILETLERTDEEIQEAVRINDLLERSGSDFITTTGKFMHSTIFDGTRLPKRFRLLDRVTGRTIAYIRPSANQRTFAAAEYLNRMVKVSGRAYTEPGLKVRVLRLRHIELLDEAERDIDSPRTVDAEGADSSN